MAGARGARLRQYAAGAGGYARRTSTRQRVGAGAAAALLVTGPFGGLRAADQPDASPIERGEAVRVGPLDVTIDRVVTVSDLEPQIRPETKGNRLLAVVGTVRNPGDRPEYAVLLTRALDVRGGGVVTPEGPVARSQLVAIEDGVGISAFNPGLTYEVAFVFEQEAGWDRQDVTVETLGYTYVDEDPLTLDDDSWLREDEVAARGEFPVKVNE